VQYARVAKKVDVRRLKEEMWRGIGFEAVGLLHELTSMQYADHILQSIPPQTPSRPPSVPISKAADGSLRFTDVMNNLQTVYPKQAMADISTSYCFICLLHLANEKGLIINNEENFQDLTIRKDHTAEITVGGE